MKSRSRGDIYIRFFRGGSESQTVLMENRQGKKFVRKSVQGDRSRKLEKQEQWLKKHAKKVIGLQIPKILQSFSEAGIYSLDLEYIPSQATLAEVILSASDREASKYIDDILLWSEKIGPLAKSKKPNYKAYFADKVDSKFSKTLFEVPQFRNILKQSEIVINNVSYEHLLTSAAKIIQTQFWKKRKFQIESKEIHGDLTLENILVLKKMLWYLDPNGDNPISDLSVEWAKLFQSLHSQYEFYPKITGCRLVSQGKLTALKIDFPKQSAYTREFLKLEKKIFVEKGPHFLALVYLHEAIHFVRLLPYKARRSPELFLPYYARAVILMSEARDRIESLL